MFEHRKMSQAVFKFSSGSSLTAAEAGLKKVIGAFTQLQEDRYTADYDVGRIWSRTDVANTLALAEEAFEARRTIRKRGVGDRF
jgi:hypothetical protein